MNGPIDKMSVAKGGKGGRIVNIASMAGFLEGTYLVFTNVSWVIEFLTCLVLKCKVFGQKSNIVE